jgi:hypothetical protein
MAGQGLVSVRLAARADASACLIEQVTLVLSRVDDVLELIRLDACLILEARVHPGFCLAEPCFTILLLLRLVALPACLLDQIRRGLVRRLRGARWRRGRRAAGRRWGAGSRCARRGGGRTAGRRRCGVRCCLRRLCHARPRSHEHQREESNLAISYISVQMGLHIGLQIRLHGQRTMLPAVVYLVISCGSPKLLACHFAPLP